MNQKLNRNHKKTNPASPGEHFGPLLTQLKRRLTGSAGKKGTYGAYLRLLDCGANAIIALRCSPQPQPPNLSRTRNICHC